ncbi:hypothetical protein [Desulforhabdus amnigena]|uniref:Uncharacterized protein n=1 Tax=Desulforhabdus amnigena TaxID=40218 RepID=A0A9W6CW10_9BACT|nr:hypothetical protein [Desulforhabdus amnigena]NLJ27251.1 hypothetical protein [Deltaproteobacteria bacterium]GLI32896.1 hypothetical protein DAMNIGENAA_03290 [Desulforhabdus amnigena]
MPCQGPGRRETSLKITHIPSKMLTGGGDGFKDITCRGIPAIYHLIQETKCELIMAGHAGVNKIILSQTMGKLPDKLLAIQEYRIIPYYSVSSTYKSLCYISPGSPGKLYK